MDERTAIELVRQRDIAGLEYLVEAHQAEALRVANVITRDKVLAEDVVQDAFLQTWDRIETFDPERPFAPWFRRCVVNLALKAAMRRERQTTLADESNESTGPVLIDPRPGPEERLERRELSTSVRQAITCLTPNQRAAIVLRYYGEFTDRETAEEFGRPTGTVKWWLHSARSRLRGLLDHLEDDEPAVHRSADKQSADDEPATG